MASIFISYSFQDRNSAESVCRFLEKGGLTCWMAPRDVVGGESYPTAILEAILRSREVLLLLSNTANGSEHVAREVCVAFENKIRILPARLEDVAARGDLLYFISGTHWRDLFPDGREDRLQVIYNDIRSYISGGVNEDGKEAECLELRELNEAAHRGNLDAQHLLGRKSADPTNPDFDLKEAARWFRRAALHGHAASAYQLARAYGKGEGVLRSQADYRRWIEEAARLGDPRAQTKLGYRLLSDTLGREKTVSEAALWFEKAAEQGGVDALYQLSVLRLEGRGVRQSDSRALDGFRILATAGHAGAQYHLAWMLVHGCGTALDREEALKWARLAASQGHERAAQLVRDLGD